MRCTHLKKERKCEREREKEKNGKNEREEREKVTEKWKSKCRD